MIHGRFREVWFRLAWNANYTYLDRWSIVSSNACGSCNATPNDRCHWYVPWLTRSKAISFSVNKSGVFVMVDTSLFSWFVPDDKILDMCWHNFSNLMKWRSITTHLLSRERLVEEHCFEEIIKWNHLLKKNDWRCVNVSYMPQWQTKK